MLDTEKKLKEPSSRAVPIILLVALCLASIAGFYFWRQSQHQGPDPEPVLTEEARAYLPNLRLDNVDMAASEDALGQTLLEITGEITNNGGRTVTLVEVNCVFREINGLEIDRQRALVVRPRAPLEPGATRVFRLPFDNIPEDWNQMIPTLFVSQIQFAD